MEKKIEKDDEQILKLARDTKNIHLFCAYVSHGEYGRPVSDAVLKTIVNEELEDAFNSIVWQYRRNFKKRKCRYTFTDQISGIALPVKLQVQILKKRNRTMVRALLQNTPLAPEAQKTLFEMNYDAQWLKMHVINMYCLNGYRFEPMWEKKLFGTLGKKNLDGCLLDFNYRDDVLVIENLSLAALPKYIKEAQLSDEGQVAALSRGSDEVARALISRFSSECGMCWQAEVKLADACSLEVINLYTAFHTMCDEALSLLKQKSEEAFEFYQSHHAC